MLLRHPESQLRPFKTDRHFTTLRGEASIPRRSVVWGVNVYMECIWHTRRAYMECMGLLFDHPVLEPTKSSGSLPIFSPELTRGFQRGGVPRWDSGRSVFGGSQAARHGLEPTRLTYSPYRWTLWFRTVSEF